ADLRVPEDAGVKARGFLRLVIEPETWTDFRSHGIGLLSFLRGVSAPADDVHAHTTNGQGSTGQSGDESGRAEDAAGWGRPRGCGVSELRNRASPAFTDLPLASATDVAYQTATPVAHKP